MLKYARRIAKWCFVGMFLVEASQASAGRYAQIAESDAWGESVEGVQLSLRIAPNLATPQVPSFQLQLRNRGASPLTYVAESLNQRSEIEIDGVWYRPAGGGGCCSNPQTVGVGSQTSPLPLMLQNRLLFAFDSNHSPTSNQLALKPGKHSIRVQTYSADGINVTVQSAAPHRIVLVSNLLGFEVQAPPVPGPQAGLPEPTTTAVNLAKGCVARYPARAKCRGLHTAFARGLTAATFVGRLALVTLSLRFVRTVQECLLL
jgi:hypothetical protein